MSLKEKVQSLDLEAPVDLFCISGNNIPPFYFCNVGNVTFQGISYVPISCEMEWLAVTSEGAVPTSRLIISDVSGIIGAVVSSYNIVGATLTALRTYSIYLDSSAGADPTQFQTLKLRINKRTWEPANMIELELITGFDIERRKIPNRAYLRRCSWLLSDSDCRAPTNIHFDLAGNPTTAANRACGKDSRFCQLYHGANWGSRFGGFIGASRK